MNVLHPSLDERKRILKNICRTKKEWKVRLVISVILFVIAVAIVVGTVALCIIFKATPTTFLIFLGGQVCVALFPFLMAFEVKRKGKYKCAQPYSSFTNGILTLSDDSLEYAFWNYGAGNAGVYSSKHAVYPECCKSIYKIDIDKISSLKIKDDICTIKGSGVLFEASYDEEKDPDDRSEKTCKQFSFVLAFEEQNPEKIINEWHSGMYYNYK